MAIAGFTGFLQLLRNAFDFAMAAFFTIRRESNVA